MLRLYNTALLPLRAGVAIWAAWASRDEGKRVEWAERRARRLPAISHGGVWIHGASVGEARIVTELAGGLRSRRPELPLAVSAYSTTGHAQLPKPPAVDAAFFVPLDFPGLATRVLDAVRPLALALVETELWPNLLHETHAAGVPVVLLNGRLSPQRMNRYRKLSRLYRPLLGRMASLGAQSSEDAERLCELGAPPEAVVVTGNIKYDLPLPRSEPESTRRRLELPRERAVFAAGSTAPNEEAMALQAFELARRNRPDLLLVLAPRHVTRADEVAELVRSRGLRCVRFSTGESAASADVLLVDTLGDLVALYQIAQVAFVGGSLVPVGGHNVLEPAALGVPVAFGPFTEHFREPAEALERAGGACRVRDAAALGDIVDRLLRDDDRRQEMARRAGQVVEANRGALERSVSLLLDALQGRSTRSTTGAA
jgi:3-deoxy-D-manno-octulosonic-acid transferase